MMMIIALKAKDHIHPRILGAPTVDLIKRKKLYKKITIRKKGKISKESFGKLWIYLMTGYAFGKF